MQMFQYRLLKQCRTYRIETLFMYPRILCVVVFFPETIYLYVAVQGIKIFSSYFRNSCTGTLGSCFLSKQVLDVQKFCLFFFNVRVSGEVHVTPYIEQHVLQAFLDQENVYYKSDIVYVQVLWVGLYFQQRNSMDVFGNYSSVVAGCCWGY